MIFFTDIAESTNKVWKVTSHFREVKQAVGSMCRRIVSARGIMSFEQEELENVKHSYVTDSKFLGKHWKITVEEYDE